MGLTAAVVVALVGAVIWLRGKLAGREFDNHARLSVYACGTLLLACFLLLAVGGFTDVGIKEVVFDGWLDSVGDSIDGTSDRDEWIARQHERSGRGALVGA